MSLVQEGTALGPIDVVLLVDARVVRIEAQVQVRVLDVFVVFEQGCLHLGELILVFYQFGDLRQPKVVLKHLFEELGTVDLEVLEDRFCLVKVGFSFLTNVCKISPLRVSVDHWGTDLPATLLQINIVHLDVGLFVLLHGVAARQHEVLARADEEKVVAAGAAEAVKLHSWVVLVNINYRRLSSHVLSFETTGCMEGRIVDRRDHLEFSNLLDIAASLVIVPLTAEYPFNGLSCLRWCSTYVSILSSHPFLVLLLLLLDATKIEQKRISTVIRRATGRY